MKVLRVDPQHPEAGAIRVAATILREGGLVAFPTETVYGLGGNALDPEAIERIFAAKGRPSYNPLIAHAADPVEARQLSALWSEPAERLANAFWPGPLTLVVPKREEIPARLTAGLPTVAIRVPSHPVAHALLREVGVPIAAPSANRFTELSPTRATHVVKGLSDRVDLVLDAGPASLGIESTVIDVSRGDPVLLRPGTLRRPDLERALGAALLTVSEVSGTAPRPGPGMVDRHYSPKARLTLFRNRKDLEAALHEHIADATKVGVLLVGDGRIDGIDPLASPQTGSRGDDEEGSLVELTRLPADPEGYARDLYAALHTFDDSGRDVILAMEVPDDGGWAGVRDRLRRASHP